MLTKLLHHPLLFLYDLFSRYALWRGSKKNFMNLGYELENYPLRLQPEDEINRPHIQLYDVVTRGVYFQDKDVLEVGCGRGGGCYYINNYKKPRSITGLDFSKPNLKFARAFPTHANITFVHGDAENFIFKNKFDIIYNVESSHCYPHVNNFYKNVFQHLHPGGYFCYADIFFERQILDKKIEELKAIGFELVEYEDITDAVVQSIDKYSEMRFPFTHKYKWLVPMALQDFQTSNRSKVFYNMQKHENPYYRFILRKPF